jgi:hypothetical protein
MKKPVYIVFNPITNMYLGVRLWGNLDEAKLYNSKSGARAVCERSNFHGVEIHEAQPVLTFSGKVTKIK